MNYFLKLYQYNKWLCFGIAAFCVLSLAANLTKNEITPAFIWGMYSEKEAPVTEYRVLKVMINDSIPFDYSSEYPDATRFYLLSPLTYYWSIAENGGVDPEKSRYRQKLGKYFGVLNPVKRDFFNDSLNCAAFMNWYGNYLEAITHIAVNKLEVNILNLAYHGEGRPEVEQESTFVKWNRP
jgi:hypothetical protein